MKEQKNLRLNVQKPRKMFKIDVKLLRKKTYNDEELHENRIKKAPLAPLSFLVEWIGTISHWKGQKSISKIIILQPESLVPVPKDIPS